MEEDDGWKPIRMSRVKDNEVDLPYNMMSNQEWMDMVTFFEENNIPWTWEDMTINRHGIPDFLKEKIYKIKEDKFFKANDLALSEDLDWQKLKKKMKLIWILKK